MKKKLVLVLIVLSVFCFTGFAQETFNFESSQYVAKAEKNEKEYTIIVRGRVYINGKWEERRERFVIISESLKKAETEAKKKFEKMYTLKDKPVPRNVVITCESTKNACDYDFNF